MSTEAIAAKWLTGLSVTGHWLRGGLLEMYLNNCSLFVFSKWRLEIGEDCVFGASSLPEQAETILASLHGRRVQIVEVTSPWLDLQITFEDGVRFATFQDSDQYENWNLRKNSPQGSYELIVAGPGKSMALF